LRDQIEKLGQSIIKAKNKTVEKLPPPAVAEKIVRPPPRPPTPTIVRPQHDEETERAIIFLQSLLRGRAIQNQMLEGKERRIQLITELKEEKSKRRQGTEVSFLPFLSFSFFLWLMKCIAFFRWSNRKQKW
jgi:hypothetical protein